MALLFCNLRTLNFAVFFVTCLYHGGTLLGLRIVHDLTYKHLLYIGVCEIFTRILLGPKVYVHLVPIWSCCILHHKKKKEKDSFKLCKALWGGWWINSVLSVWCAVRSKVVFVNCLSSVLPGINVTEIQKPETSYWSKHLRQFLEHTTATLNMCWNLSYGSCFLLRKCSKSSLIQGWLISS